MIRTHTSQALTWVALLGSSLGLLASSGRALVTKPASVRRLLRHLGEPTAAPPLAPARDPPFYRSAVLRRRNPRSGPQRQVEMFSLGP